MTLAADAISHAYRRGIPVLSGVSLSVEPGEFLAIVGPNGAGKTTLLRCLAGLLEPTSGRATLAGRPIRSLGHAERAGRIAYLPQRPDVAMPLTVRQVVAFGPLTLGDAATRDRLAGDWLGRVGLAERADEPFITLSVGQQQRAGVARAFAQLEAGQPGGILLADEPVSAMDPRHALETVAHIRDATGGETPIGAAVVLHDLAAAARFADRVVLLDAAGAVAADGPAEQALAPETLAPVFGVEFELLSSADGPIPVPLLP